MTKYLCLWAVCLILWNVPPLLPEADGIQWYQTQALWSLLVIFIVLEIERTALTASIALIELASMFFQLFAGWGYRSPESPLTYFYDNYEIYLISANILEAILLCLGVPGGIINRFPALRGFFSHWRTNTYRPYQNQNGYEEEKWR